jgi:uncharacterized protein (TIGR02594 family)
MTTSERLYTQAKRDLGLKEVPGPKSSPRIQLAIKAAADWLDSDDSKTAWCGCIRGLWAMETGTGMPSAHYRARNWLNWGEEVRLTDAQRGDTVVLIRDGGYHVALFDHLSTDRTQVYLLGGNQGNEVNVRSFNVALVRGVRR